MTGHLLSFWPGEPSRKEKTPMGVWGWDEIKDGVTVKGFVRGKAKYHSGDGDWCFFVEPAPEFKQLLTNPAG